MNNGSLDIQSVTVHFGGVTALDDVSLTAAPRKITGIIGPNGAGKTTLTIRRAVSSGRSPARFPLTAGR